MTHVIENALSGRSRCKGCGRVIAKGDRRFGERLPNAFGDGEMTLWFHVPCAALKRPDAYLETVRGHAYPESDRDDLRALAEEGLTHHRLPRIDAIERAPGGRARCRACHVLIETGAWRIRLVRYAEGMFNPTGFVHARCAPAYFGTRVSAARLRHFVPALAAADLASLAAELSA